MRITVAPDARNDLDEATAFYRREGSAALAARFVAEFRRVTGLMAAYPEIGSPRSRGRRGLRMNVFPCTVIYRVEQETICVLVVKHDRRKPGYGSSRRQNR